MKAMKVRCATSVTMLMVLSGLALAEPPAVLDRVPKDATVVVAVRNVDALKGKVAKLFKALSVPDSDSKIDELDQLIGVEGFNKAGSFAMVFLRNAEDPSEIGPDRMVMLVPVTDFAKFVEAEGGDPKAKEIELAKLGGMGAKNVGNGYVVMSESAEALSRFDAPAGQMKSHITNLGKTGARVADTADVLVMADISIFAEKLLIGFDEGFDQMENFAGAMGGGDEEGAKQILGSVKTSMRAMIRDMKTGIVGAGMTDEGIALDLAVQFKDGSDTAGELQYTGKIAGLTGKLPKIPFMVAGAMDMRNPLIRKMQDFGKKMGEMTGGSLSFMNAGMKMLDKVDGQAFVMGTNAAIFQAGLLSNMVTYTATSDAAGYVKASREVIEGANNKTEKGLTLKTTYTPDGAEAGGKRADVWSVTMDVDPNDANADKAAQIKQMMQMLLGQQEKVTGMIAQTDGGVIQTMSTNPELVTKAIEAAGGKGGLASGEWFKLVSSNLPANRTFEIYLGIKGLSDTAGAFMQMMGMPMPFELKDDLPPLGLAGTTDGGAVSIRAYVPMSTIKGVGEAVKKMEEDHNNPAAEKPNPDRRKPRF